MSPLVSIIIPVYNHERFVAQALESVRAQSWPNWELIIIDDGSTDGSAQVVQEWLQRWEPPRVRFIAQENRGSHHTINRGLSLATGSYLTVLNSDDRFHPLRIERLMHHARQSAHSEATWAAGSDEFIGFTAVQLIDAQSLVVEGDHPSAWWQGMYRQMQAQWQRHRADGSMAAAQTLLWGNITVSTSNAFVSQALWRRLGPLRRLRYVLDWEYALRAAIAAPQAFHLIDDEVLLDYRLHGANTILSGALRNHIEAAYILRRAQRRMSDRGWAVAAEGIWRLKYLERFIRQESLRQQDERLRRSVWSLVEDWRSTAALGHPDDSASPARSGPEGHQAAPPDMLTVLHEIKLERAQLQVQAEAAQQALRVEMETAQARLRTQEAEAQARIHAAELQRAQTALELAERTTELQATTAQLSRAKQALQSLELEAAQHRSAGAHLQAVADQQAQALAEMRASTSWRVTAPLRALGRLQRAGRDGLKGMSQLIGRAHRVWRREGWAGLSRRAASRWGIDPTARHGLARAVAVLPPAVQQLAGLAPAADPYDTWLQHEHRRAQALCAAAPQLLQAMVDPPLISLIIPAYDTPPDMLRALMKSIRAQCYPHWEVCLVDDASRRADSAAAMAEEAQHDTRIRLRRREFNGHIAAASNDGLAMARGAWVAFVDHDDELPPHALLRLAQEIQAHPQADLFYSDEDKIDLAGRRSLPLFKPDWSPALAWGQNYVGHLMCIRRSRLARLGGLADGLDGSQDHDLVLRLAADGAVFHHIPEVLYHWRLHPQSTSEQADSKPYAHTAGERAVERHLQRRYPDRFSHLEGADKAFVYSPRFELPPDTLVSIIIPTRDRVDLLKACIDSILQRSTGVAYEIIVVDNGSVEPATHHYLQALRAAHPQVQVLRDDRPFNWSALNNAGVKRARGSVYVFLNNDTLVITPDWLQRLAEFALLPDVGTVGAMLLFEDGSIQHAGVVVGMGGWADHVYRTAHPINYPSPYIASVVTRNVLASTGACVAVSQDAFRRLGGFDEAFEICGSDVELGLRAHRRGLQNIYLATVQLHHLESKTRTPHVPANDFVQSELKYAPYRTEGDPFYNRNLDPLSQQPRARHPDAANHEASPA